MVSDILGEEYPVAEEDGALVGCSRLGRGSHAPDLARRDDPSEVGIAL